MANEMKKLYVERETFEKNGKTYWSYFIKGNVRGKDVRVQIVPPDRGGYTVLDIVFGDADKVEVVVKPFEIKDENTGRIIAGNTYAIQSVGENGEVYECTIKPSRISDKALINMMLQ